MDVVEFSWEGGMMYFIWCFHHLVLIMMTMMMMMTTKGWFDLGRKDKRLVAEAANKTAATLQALEKSLKAAEAKKLFWVESGAKKKKHWELNEI